MTLSSIIYNNDIFDVGIKNSPLDKCRRQCEKSFVQQLLEAIVGQLGQAEAALSASSLLEWLAFSLHFAHIKVVEQGVVCSVFIATKSWGYSCSSVYKIKI